MEVEQPNFVTHNTFDNYNTIKFLIFLNPSVIILSNKFQMVMINSSKPCASL